MPAFAALHPCQTNLTGVDEIFKGIDKALCEITGMKRFTFKPCAGAHGELAGLMIMREYHLSRGDTNRTRIIVPDEVLTAPTPPAPQSADDVVG